MSSIKSFLGTLAVLLSIQPLASWAANSNQNQETEAMPTSGQKNEKSEKAAVLVNLNDHKRIARGEGGSPTCGTGG